MVAQKILECKQKSDILLKQYYILSNMCDIHTHAGTLTFTACTIQFLNYYYIQPRVLAEIKVSLGAVSTHSLCVLAGHKTSAILCVPESSNSNRQTALRVKFYYHHFIISNCIGVYYEMSSDLIP